jgi:acyl transferase domain-containing protein
MSPCCPTGKTLSEPELDGHDEDPVVVCGFAVKFPGDASNSEAFWKMMLEKQCASSEFPRQRVNIDGFYQKDSNRLNTVIE